MNYSASSVATRQKSERIIRCCESFYPTIFVYDAPIPERHKATIHHFLDLVRRVLGDVELDWRFWGLVGSWLIVVIAHGRFFLFGLARSAASLT
jgi:hypothetical protein